jgi:hypothetical protein
MQPQSQTTLCWQQDGTEPKLPSVISEGLVNQFKYWDQTIQRGMYHNNELYTYFQSYPLTDRLKAYAFACEQTERGIGVCITVTKTHYSIWFNLRSLTSPSSDELPPSGPIDRVLAATKCVEDA